MQCFIDTIAKRTYLGMAYVMPIWIRKPAHFLETCSVISFLVPHARVSSNEDEASGHCALVRPDSCRKFTFAARHEVPQPSAGGLKSKLRDNCHSYSIASSTIHRNKPRF